MKHRIKTRNCFLQRKKPALSFQGYVLQKKTKTTLSFNESVSGHEPGTTTSNAYYVSTERITPQSHQKLQAFETKVIRETSECKNDKVNE
jgi:hypothetical protein